MNILFTICGRAGSKGIRNKNIKEFLDHPLPFYTVSAINLYTKLHPENLYNVALNTDSIDLMNLFRDELNLDIDIVERRAELGLDNTPKVSVILNTYEEIKKRKKIDYDMVVDLDITSPLRTVMDIENLIDKKKEVTADVVFSVTDSRRNPYFNMVMKTVNGYERVIQSSFNTRQEAPEIYDMNASMYAYSPSFLVSEKAIFEGKCDVIKMMDTAVLDLDHENDFELMIVIAKYIYKTYIDYNEVVTNINNIRS